MEIKTIVHEQPGEFDKQVNGRLKEGFILERRDLIVPNTAGTVAHYAQLVKPDEVMAEEVEVDPLDAVRFLRNFCKSVPECGPACPLAEWCDTIPDHLAPAHWMVPEKED